MPTSRKPDQPELTVADLQRVVAPYDWSIQETEHAPDGIYVLTSADGTGRIVVFNAVTRQRAYDAYCQKALTATEGYWPPHVTADDVILAMGQQGWAREILSKRHLK
jgi:hypothetical protein